MNENKTVVIVGAGASGLRIAERHIEVGHKVYLVDFEGKINELKKSEGFYHQQKGQPDTQKHIKLTESNLIVANDAKTKFEKIGKPDLVYSTAPNIDVNGLIGIEYALKTAQSIAKGAPIIEGSNGSKDHNLDLENIGNNIAFATINHPAKKEVTGDKVISIALNSDEKVKDKGFAIVKGDSLEEARAIIIEAGFGIEERDNPKDLFYAKAPSISSMPIQMMLNGTGFADAADQNTPTGQVARELLKDFYDLAKRKAEKGEIKFEYESFENFYEKQSGIMAKKGSSPGSMFMASNNGAPVEVAAIIGSIAKDIETEFGKQKAANFNTVKDLAIQYAKSNQKEEFAQKVIDTIKEKGVEGLSSLSASLKLG